MIGRREQEYSGERNITGEVIRNKKRPGCYEDVAIQYKPPCWMAGRKHISFRQKILLSDTRNNGSSIIFFPQDKVGLYYCLLHFRQTGQVKTGMRVMLHLPCQPQVSFIVFFEKELFKAFQPVKISTGFPYFKQIPFKQIGSSMIWCLTLKILYKWWWSELNDLVRTK